MSTSLAGESQELTATALAAELGRIELLGRLLGEQRRGQRLEEEQLDRLRAVQRQVQAARSAGTYPLLNGKLSNLEYDVLFCALGPEVEPRVGWMFQQLQGGVHPFPTRALIQELLAMDHAEASALEGVLAPGSVLRRSGWIRVDDGEHYQPIRPMPGLAARLLERSIAVPPPPGASVFTLSGTFADLVVTPRCRAMMSEFLLWIRHRSKVVDEWGGQACGGPVLLFSGPSGTGKTFAAAMLAKEAGWTLYRVDLSQVVNKYIGETEKNLARLFDATNGQEIILFFDEADSIFAKRTQIQDAHDRYANLEIGYLLQRLETHQGPCILATNLRENLDPSLARRFQMVIEFTRPDPAQRADLWRRLLPPRAPVAPEVDPAVLGRAVNLTGGQIRNAALHAAYLAAARGSPIALKDIALAVWRELGKEDRAISRADLGGLQGFIQEESL